MQQNDNCVQRTGRCRGLVHYRPLGLEAAPLLQWYPSTQEFAEDAEHETDSGSHCNQACVRRRASHTEARAPQLNPTLGTWPGLTDRGGLICIHATTVFATWYRFEHNVVEVSSGP